MDRKAETSNTTSISTSVKLGQSTNLLNGYKTNICGVAYHLSVKPALNVVPIDLKNPNNEVKWPYPVITFHKNREELLTELFQIKIRPTSFEDDPTEGGATPQWPTGALILSGLTDEAQEQALPDLSDQIGIDLSTTGLSYALVRRTRVVGTATHVCFQRGIFGNIENTLQPDTLAALKSLGKKAKHSYDVDLGGAKSYLDFYKTFGTHFVSEVDVGDTIFQVFAYVEEQFQFIRNFYEDQRNSLSGPTSWAFVHFTTRKNSDGYGYSSAIGRIGITSGDSSLKQSIDKGLWKEDTYAGTNSIFAPYIRSDAINANNTFRKLTVVTTELASLETFAEYYRMRIWRRIFKGAMYVKFADGHGVTPYFSNTCQHDLTTMFNNSDPLGGDGLLSTLATRSVNVWQEMAELRNINLQFPELVHDFSVFSNVIKISSPDAGYSADIVVPGSSTATLISYIISTGGPHPCPVPPKLTISDAAYKSFQDRLSCGEFYGGLRVCSEHDGKSFVVMNGLIFEVRDGDISVVKDVRLPPARQIANDRFVDIEFALVAAEARLQFYLQKRNNKDQIKIMKGVLLWLASMIDSTTKTKESSALQARAMYLAQVTSNSYNADVLVPYLKYDAYKDVVSNVQEVLKTASEKLTDFQNQIRARKREERDIARTEKINKNIIHSGKLLESYIRTQAEVQMSMEDMFSGVIEERKASLAKTVDEASKLSVSLEKQRVAVDEKVEEYKEKVAEWKNNKTISACLDIASSVFSLGFTLIIPASSFKALENLGKTVQNIQKVVKVFEAVIKVYKAMEAVPSGTESLIKSLDAVGTDGLQIPSSLEWDEMEINMTATLNTGPDIPAKTMLSAAFGVLVLRGKALLECQSTIQQISADISSAEKRAKIHKEQKERLSKLKANLDSQPSEHDLANVDLLSLSGKLVFFQSQMLLILSNVISIQDRALQYEYLRPPTPIGPFNPLSMQLVILRQSQSINQGLNIQPLPTEVSHPIVYEVHGVRPENITNNNKFSFNITLNKKEFSSYNFVRVKKIRVEIGGIASTKSGKYYTELVFDGKPFHDRGFDREILTFQTNSRIYTGLQEVTKSSYHTSPESFNYDNNEGTFDGNVSYITPFSKWYISLPATSSNECLIFKRETRGVTIRIIFHIIAQLKEVSKFQHFNIPRMACFAAAPRTTATESSTVSRSVNVDVLTLMSGKSVCCGWDAVFSMSAEQVNQQLLKQYEDREGNKIFLRKIEDKSTRTTSEGDSETSEFEFQLDSPKIQFNLNNKTSLQVHMAILSGYYKLTILFKGDKKPHVIDNKVFRKTDKCYIEGDAPLAFLRGVVTPQHHLTINLKGGAFSPKNFKAKVNLDVLQVALQSYFTNLKDGYELYKIGTLDTSNFTGLTSLTPSVFEFDILHTNSSRDLIQLYIATTGKVKDTHHLFMAVDEPVPAEYESSLIINSKIFFKDVIPTALGDGGVGLVLEPMEPQDNKFEDKLWSSRSTAGNIRIAFPPKCVGKTYSPKPKYNYIAVPNNEVNVSLNLTVTPGDDGDVKVTHNNKYTQAFRYGSTHNEKVPPNNYKDYSVKVKIKMTWHIPLVVVGSGMQQMVGFGVNNASEPKIDAFLQPPAGACKTNDRELQKDFFKEYKASVPPALKNVFNKSFKSVSLFALKNILFPGKNLIDMKKAYLPGDMVIFGNFT